MSLSCGGEERQGEAKVYKAGKLPKCPININLIGILKIDENFT